MEKKRGKGRKGRERNGLMALSHIVSVPVAYRFFNLHSSIVFTKCCIGYQDFSPKIEIKRFSSLLQVPANFYFLAS